MPSAAGTTDLAVNDRVRRIDQIRVACDLPKTFSPIIAAPGKNLNVIIDDVQLNAIAVEFDFVNPTFAARDTLDLRRYGRADKSWIGRLDTNRGLLLTLKRHQADHIGNGN